jgi:hypothetical protein
MDHSRLYAVKVLTLHSDPSPLRLDPDPIAILNIHLSGRLWMDLHNGIWPSSADRLDLTMF